MMETIKNALISALNSSADSPGNAVGAPASDGTPTSSLVSRILQVALGLFVSTVDLPSLSPDLQSSPTIGFDCDFSLPCRWNSIGNSADRWKLAKGEPDSILWLAATGTMVQPAEPFALLEMREGRIGQMLCSEEIHCQEEDSLFSFTYWTIGNSDLEICLLDTSFTRYNCTGMLEQTKVQPGKVALRIPAQQRSFHIAIIPNAGQGVLVIDDIKYDARYCQDRHRGVLLSTRSTTTESVTTPNAQILLWTTNSTSSTIEGPSTPPLFTSPVPIVGPVSTASPLPNPFTVGPSLPMGPFILPPLLPGPPAGIVNPFVVAPLIPPTSTYASFTMPSPLPSTTNRPHIIIITAATQIVDKGNSAESSGGSSSISEEEEIETERASKMTKLTTTGNSVEDLSMFTSTIISARTWSRTIAVNGGPGTSTRHTRAPTGIPNIEIGHLTTTVEPLPNFELLIVGNRTRPLFDRRLGKVTEETEDLLCDFAHTFPCLWGAEAGRWAIVEEGAIPSLDKEMARAENEEAEAPKYPAAVVIQGTAMLSSDPLRCQSGEGKLLFRYWTNGRVLVQVCAMGWGVDSAKIQCVEEVAQHNRMDPSSLAIFELPDPIREPFTLNVVPIWEKNAQNNYLLIDEIAYIGECNLTALNEIDEEENRREIGTGRVIGTGTASGKPQPIVTPVPPLIPPHFTTTQPQTIPTISSTTTTTTTTLPSTTSSIASTPVSTTSTQAVPPPTENSTSKIATLSPISIVKTTTAPSAITTSEHITSTNASPHPTPSYRTRQPSSARTKRPRTRRPLVINVLPGQSANSSPFPPMPFPRPITEENAHWLTTRKPGTRYPFYPSTPTVGNYRMTTPPWGPSRELPTGVIDWTTPKSPDGSSEEHGGEISTIYPGIEPNHKKRPSVGTTVNSFTIPYTTTQRYKPTTQPIELNYCKLLNCDFNENACHYLNHGLTRVPWTLRTKGYGFPLNRNTDLRPTTANGQFVSCVLGPGDFAILESPRFNLTDGINVLLFQYFRPTHSSTIRLCLGTRYTKPLRTVSAFLQCPPILRSVTSKNTPKWNSVHIQLPPGTSHFYLVAHNLDRSSEKTAIAIDNIRVAICDPRATYDPEDPDLAEAEPQKTVPSARTKEETDLVDSKELYEDLTEVNEEDTNERI